MLADAHQAGPDRAGPGPGALDGGSQSGQAVVRDRRDRSAAAAPGLDLVRSTAALNPAKPWFAIGGIDQQRLPEVLAAGARRIVVVRAITAAEDPRAAAAELKTGISAAG